MPRQIVQPDTPFYLSGDSGTSFEVLISVVDAAEEVHSSGEGGQSFSILIEHFDMDYVWVAGDNGAVYEVALPTHSVRGVHGLTPGEALVPFNLSWYQNQYDVTTMPYSTEWSQGAVEFASVPLTTDWAIEISQKVPLSLEWSLVAGLSGTKELILTHALEAPVFHSCTPHGVTYDLHAMVMSTMLITTRPELHAGHTIAYDSIVPLQASHTIVVGLVRPAMSSFTIQGWLGKTVEASYQIPALFITGRATAALEVVSRLQTTVMAGHAIRTEPTHIVQQGIEVSYLPGYLLQAGHGVEGGLSTEVLSAFDVLPVLGEAIQAGHIVTSMMGVSVSAGIEVVPSLGAKSPVSAGFVTSYFMLSTQTLAPSPTKFKLVNQSSTQGAPQGSGDDPSDAEKAVEVSLTGYTIALSEGSTYWTCQLQLANVLDARLLQVGTEFSLTFDPEGVAEDYGFVVETLSITKQLSSEQPSFTASISGVSPIKLWVEQTTDITKVYGDSMAVSELVTDISGGRVVWGCVDWLLTPNKIQLLRRKPYEAISMLAQSIGAVVEADKLGTTLHVRSKFPTSVPKAWDSISHVINEGEHTFSVQGSSTTPKVVNYYEVYDYAPAGGGGDTLTWEPYPNGQLCGVVHVTIRSVNSYKLKYHGNNLVMRPLGRQPYKVKETLTFQKGVAQASRPISKIDAVTDFGAGITLAALKYAEGDTTITVDCLDPNYFYGAATVMYSGVCDDYEVTFVGTEPEWTTLFFVESDDGGY